MTSIWNTVMLRGHHQGAKATKTVFRDYFPDVCTNSWIKMQVLQCAGQKTAMQRAERQTALELNISILTEPGTE